MSGPVLLVLRLLFAVALFAFLIGMLWILWRDLGRQRDLVMASQPAPLTLFVAGLPPRLFTGSLVIVGRDPVCDLHLDDPTVSAQHARLSYHHNQWWIEDLRSRNGTLLNDELVTTATVITHGDVIRCGGVTVQVGDSNP
ncbi:MAG: FHA domain-containing protein [Chloroflexota bacterium]